MRADDILEHPRLADCVRAQAQALLQTHQASPRTASPFATQQRWLMAQAALAKYFRSDVQEPGRGILAERFIDIVDDQRLASRNTAAAFVQEMLKYGIVRHVAGSEGRRRRPFEPSPATLAMLLQWLAIHLATLDGLDGGSRETTLRARPALLAVIQPMIADGLLATAAVRSPGRTFSLFTWINDGGIVMDRLIAGCATSQDLPQLLTDVRSISMVAKYLNLSRTQLGRKFAAAEAMGSLGWSGVRGRSALWLSAEFLREYHMAQAVKLAIVDAAFATGCAQEAGDREMAASA